MQSVTREEFESFKIAIMEQFAVLNQNISALVTELKVNNANACKDILMLNEKVDSLQTSRTELWKIINELKIKVYIAWSIPPIVFGFLELYRHFKP